MPDRNLQAPVHQDHISKKIKTSPVHAIIGMSSLALAVILCCFHLVLDADHSLANITKIESSLLAACIVLSGSCVATMKLEQVMRGVGHYLAQGQNSVALMAQDAQREASEVKDLHVKEAAVIRKEAESLREVVNKIEKQTNGNMAASVREELEMTAKMLPMDEVQKLLRNNCANIALDAARHAIAEYTLKQSESRSDKPDDTHGQQQ